MYSRPEQVMVHIHDLLQDNLNELGLSYVVYGEERLTPRYPAAIVTAEPLTREHGATRGWEVTLRATIWVLHAKLSETHKQRTLEDMQLATAVVEFLHNPTNRTLTKDSVQGVLFGFVTSEDPGVLVRGKNDVVVGTRISWEGTSKHLWED